MCRLLPVNIKLVVCENRTAYGADGDGLVLDVHLFYHLCHKLVDCSVRTTWAVVHYVVCKNGSLLVDNVLGFLDIFYIHGISLFQIVELLESLRYFIRSVDVSSLSSVETYRAGSVDSQSYIVYHLTEVELDAHHALYLS